MKKIFYTLFCIYSLISMQGHSQTPDFTIAGFATLNGGTTGGEGGTVVNVSSYADLKKYAETKDTRYIIKVSGTISGSGSVLAGTYSGSIRVASNKSIIGAGNDAFLKGVGLSISGAKNIIIQNLIFTMTGIEIPAGSGDIPNIYSKLGDEGRAQILVNGGDCISIYGTGTRNIWVDHCEFFNEDPTIQKNQDLYDGLIDAKNDASYITISWCYFHDHHKSGLVGSSDSDDFDRRITFHHNYWKNIGERMPLYRFGTGHFFNNYVLGGAYGGSGSAINSRMGACLLIENNYFEDKQDPIITKNSKQDGYWIVKNNIFVNCEGSQPTTNTCNSFAPPYNYSDVFTSNTELVKTMTMNYCGAGKPGTVTGSDNEATPMELNSLTAYPNPCRDKTTVSFYLQSPSNISINITDISGNIKKEIHSELSSGRHTIEVNTEKYVPGVYLIKLNTDGKWSGRKLIVGTR